MKKVLIAGELNPDLILQNYRSFPELGKEVLVEDCCLTLGSASAICAVGLAKLGRPVAFFAKVGRDAYGDFCVAALESAGVDARRVIRDGGLKTGITVSITGPQDRALVTYLGAILSLAAGDITDEMLAGFDHLHVSSYYLQERLRPGIPDLFERASRQGLTTSLDPGFDPSEEWGPGIYEALRQTDVFFPNEVELRAIGGHDDPASALARLENGRTLTIAKLGRSGAMTLAEGRPLHVAALPVQSIDSTGAGDSFNAGFLHCWLRGDPLAEVLTFAAACGALSTLGFGGTGAQATEPEARRFIAEVASLEAR